MSTNPDFRFETEEKLYSYFSNEHQDIERWVTYMKRSPMPNVISMEERLRRIRDAEIYKKFIELFLTPKFRAKKDLVEKVRRVVEATFYGRENQDTATTDMIQLSLVPGLAPIVKRFELLEKDIPEIVLDL